MCRPKQVFHCKSVQNLKARIYFTQILLNLGTSSEKNYWIILISPLNFNSRVVLDDVPESRMPECQKPKTNGPQLFNCLPPFLRNMTKCSVEIFKEELDKYLMTIPVTQRQIASAQRAQRRWQRGP